MKNCARLFVAFCLTCFSKWQEVWGLLTFSVSQLEYFECISQNCIHFQPLSHNEGIVATKSHDHLHFPLPFENIYIREFWNSLTTENDAINLDWCRGSLVRILIFSSCILSNVIGVFFESMKLVFYPPFLLKFLSCSV